ncbi:UDP-galactose 4-epimerase [Marinimicrobium koreense]|uniref:UDP-glucose 4-epimerase n=1 Tax=Marinimicrobium koreense TaxID=306545 RepID=A0A3N1NS94_9GAMM|nr:UDP-glucose 4-epimerase GalE [Marinimicrobium koreense]ROQ21722.1 UDP-galactose 4-epimerase [Marinimicrobium koreense]
MKILVTGGLGYIGLHTCVELLSQGHQVVILDNLANSKRSGLDRLKQISGQSPSFYEADIRNRAALECIFTDHRFDAVMHFAGLKAVGESTQIPLDYYDVNVHGTRQLVSVMLEHHVSCIVFSSSATVYGNPASVPIQEDFPMSATNPYGRTKWLAEQMLEDVAHAERDLSVILLRYFNPGGAHESGLIGEDPNGIPNNLMPYIAQVAVGRRPSLSIFGNDYPTKDGTGVRDYIHVVDLARGHLAALEHCHTDAGVHIYNLGTGRGYSVLDIVDAFERATGRPIPYELAPRRAGDIAECWADPAKAERELHWRAELGIDLMAEDVWRWQSTNPNGFQ